MSNQDNQNRSDKKGNRKQLKGFEPEKQDQRLIHLLSETGIPQVVEGDPSQIL